MLLCYILTVRADIQKTSVNAVWGPNGPQVLRSITTPFCVYGAKKETVDYCVLNGCMRMHV